MTHYAFKTPDFVLRKDPDVNPVIPGIMFFHGDSVEGTFDIYFEKLAGYLRLPKKDDNKDEIDYLMISDKEKALVGSKKKCFPNSIQLLCHEHQKENLAANCVYDSNSVKFNMVMTIVMVDMAGADSREAFQKAKAEILSDFDDAFPGNYFETFSKTLWECEVEPRLRFPKVIPKNAKTNGIEANNSRAKRYIEHTPRTLYEAIFLMKEMVQTMLENMIQALLGEGPWQIALGSKLKIIDKAAWARKSPTQQMNEFMRIVCGVSNRKKTEVDNLIPDLNLSNGVKKKKHQRTRCQANRTYTPTTKAKYNLNHTA